MGLVNPLILFPPTLWVPASFATLLHMCLFPPAGNIGAGARAVPEQPYREEAAESRLPALPLSDGRWCRDDHSPCSHSGKLGLQLAALCHYGKPGYRAEPEGKKNLRVPICTPEEDTRSSQEPKTLLA